MIKRQDLAQTVLSQRENVLSNTDTQVDKGIILTMNQSDMASVDGYSIETIPIWRWITESEK